MYCLLQAEPAVPPVPPIPPGTSSDTAAAAEGVQPAAKPQLPSCLNPERYSIAAFQALISQTDIPTAGQSLTSKYDRSSLVEVVQDVSLPLSERVVLLQQGAVPPAVLPVALLVELVKGWVATENWNSTPATDWVTSSWALFTTEQVSSLRASLTDLLLTYLLWVAILASVH